MAQLTASITYGRSEYISIAADQMLVELRNEAVRKRKAVAPEELPLALKIALKSIFPIIYWYKVRKVGVCTFSIDDDKIERQSQLGSYSVKWSDVTELHRHTAAYLVMFKGGGFPLPYRCFKGSAGEALEQLVMARQAQLDAEVEPDEMGSPANAMTR